MQSWVGEGTVRELAGVLFSVQWSKASDDVILTASSMFYLHTIQPPSGPLRDSRTVMASPRATDMQQRFPTMMARLPNAACHAEAAKGLGYQTGAVTRIHKSHSYEDYISCKYATGQMECKVSTAPYVWSTRACPVFISRRKACVTVAQLSARLVRSGR
jgi:hypothetical protein